MREHVDFIRKPPTTTKRDDLARVLDGDQAENARISKPFGFDQLGVTGDDGLVTFA